MPRLSRSRPSYTIDLFPFLSILACTIGCLVLIIIVITSELVGNQQQITIVARTEDGVNQTKQPRYLECRSEGVVIYPEEQLIPGDRLEGRNSPFNRFLNSINRNQEYIIVAVRGDGIDTFEKVRDLIEAKGIDIGYEPLDDGWQLRIETAQD